MIATTIKDDSGGKWAEYKKPRKQGRAAESANIKVFPIAQT